MPISVDNPTLIDCDFQVTTPVNSVTLPVHSMSFTLLPVGALTMSANLLTLRWNEAFPLSDPLANLRMVATSDTAGWLDSNPLIIRRNSVDTAFGSIPYVFGDVAAGATDTFYIGIRPAVYATRAVMVEISFQDGPDPVLFGNSEQLPCPYTGSDGYFVSSGRTYSIFMTITTEAATAAQGSFTWSVQ